MYFRFDLASSSVFLTGPISLAACFYLTALLIWQILVPECANPLYIYTTLKGHATFYPLLNILDIILRYNALPHIYPKVYHILYYWGADTVSMMLNQYIP